MFLFESMVQEINKDYQKILMNQIVKYLKRVALFLKRNNKLLKLFIFFVHYFIEEIKNAGYAEKRYSYEYFKSAEEFVNKLIGKLISDNSQIGKVISELSSLLAIN